MPAELRARTEGGSPGEGPLPFGLSRVAAEASALAAILIGAGLLFANGLRAGATWDEAVYLGQTDALAHGQHLGTGVFTAQPPGFHWLLLAASWIDGVGIDQLRLADMAVALVGLLAVYAAGRAVAGPVAGLLSAALLAIAPSYPTFAAEISADLPGTVLAALSLACFVVPTRHRRLRLVAAGLLFAAAESVKLDAFILLLPVPLYCAGRRLRLADLGIAASAVAIAFVAGAAALGGALPGVWRSAVAYHVAARRFGGSTSANVHALESFFHPHQPFTWLTLVAAVAALLLRPRTQLPLWPLWITAAASVLFLLWHKPLRDNHLVLLAVALAVPVGASLAAAATQLHRLKPVALGGLAVVLAAAYAQDVYHLRKQVPLMPGLTWAAKRVEAAVPPGRLVVSDQPIVPFLAHRRMPGQTIDTALLRFDSGYLTDRTVLRAIDEYRVPVVVVGRSFYTRPRILAVLAKQFPRHVTFDTITVYYRSR
ncbi:MAG TPA: glycosyltransferase family 39 protein [Gaiellaceae bacterium]